MTKLTRFETAAWLRQNDRFCIVTHRKPDGDTIGSAAALCRGLRAMGKTAHVLENREITERYRPLLAGLTCTESYPGATVVSVDVASESMFPGTLAYLKDRVSLAIDHHSIHSGFATQTLVDPEAAACGEIIYDLLNILKVPMSRDMARALYIAVSTDTGCFRFSNTTAHTLHTAAACLETGIDAYTINKELFETVSLARLKLNAYMAEHLELMNGGQVALCLVPLEAEHACGVSEDDMESVSNFARNVEGVKLAVTFRTELSGDTKLSVRSAPGWNAAKVCAALGGGGHEAAAGARFPGTQAQAREEILEILKEQGYL